MTTARPTRSGQLLLAGIAVAVALTVLFGIVWFGHGESPAPAAAAPASGVTFTPAEPAPEPVPPPQALSVLPAPSAKGASLRLTIPALGNSSRNVKVLEGWDTEQIDQGIGHYLLSDGPGEVGNYVLAGHRSSRIGYEPWANLPNIPNGSEVIIRSPKAVYTYTLFKSREVLPEEMWTVAQKPVDPKGKAISAGDVPGGTQLITLVTCTPRYGHSGRFIWWGHLSSVTPRDT